MRKSYSTFSSAIALLTLALPAIACPPRPTNASLCLPKNIQPTTVVSAQLIGWDPQKPPVVKTVTVRQTLTQMKAKCDRKGVLTDAQGREIRFYQQPSIGCGGPAPTPEMIKQLERSRLDLEKLQSKYTVITLTCNPSGIPIP